MFSVRRAVVEDLPQMQQCNLVCLPENYQLKYYMYHLLTWPQLSYLAEDDRGKVVGYVLGKMDEESDKAMGHITSIAVLRTYRKTDIAKQLMVVSQQSMIEQYDAEGMALHVRRSNEAALHLYKNVMGFSVKDVEVAYYADKEDAFAMRKFFTEEEKTIAMQWRNGVSASDAVVPIPKGSSKSNPVVPSKADGKRAIDNGSTDKNDEAIKEAENGVGSMQLAEEAIPKDDS